MFEIKMSLNPTTRELKQWVEGMEKHVLEDLTPFWDSMAQPLVVEEIARIFATQGHGSWAPLSDKYHLYKSRVFPGKTILRRKDTYFRASTRKGAGNVYERDKDRMEWGVDLDWFASAFGYPYPVAHEEGRGANPKRPVYELAANSRALNNNLVLGLRQYLHKSIAKEAKKVFK